MLVIGLNGKKQSGKDSFANFAEEILPGQVGRISFAHPLKMFCVNYLGIPTKNCFGNDFEKDQWVSTWGVIFDNPKILAAYKKEADDPISGREVLQVVGTDIFRENLNKNVWVDILARRLESGDFDNAPPQGRAKVVCITDVRFPNEVKRCADSGYKLVRLYRYTGKTDSIEHASETVFDQIDDDEFDYIIEAQQNTTLKVLKRQVIKILNSEGLLDTACE